MGRVQAMLITQQLLDSTLSRGPLPALPFWNPVVPAESQAHREN